MVFGAPQPCTCKLPTNDADNVPPESDEALLAIYIKQISAHFPFVVLPVNSTAQQLQREKPFLLKVIRMVASVRNLSSMRAQSRDILRHMSEAMLLSSERSMDLLQGVLVFLGYYHYHCITHAQFSNLIHLAVSLVEDMDLITGSASHFSPGILPLMRGPGARPKTNDERRALLGVWYMSSV